MAHGGKRVGAGRKPGPVPKYQGGIETFSKRIVEDEQVQALLLSQAQAGSLAVPLYQLFFYYAYGRPREQQTDDQAFLKDLLAVVLKHAGSREARQEIRAVIQAHDASAARLSAVA